MTDFDELLEKAETASAKRETVDIQVVLGEALIDLRAVRIDGLKWVDMKAEHPGRPGAALDSNVGFNVHSLARAYMKLHGFLVDDKKNEVRLGSDQWDRTFRLMSGPDIDVVATAIWGINEYDPRRERDRLKKASQAVFEKKQN